MKNSFWKTRNSVRVGNHVFTDDGYGGYHECCNPDCVVVMRHINQVGIVSGRGSSAVFGGERISIRFSTKSDAKTLHRNPPNRCGRVGISDVA